MITIRRGIVQRSIFRPSGAIPIEPAKISDDMFVNTPWQQVRRDRYMTSGF
jgi:hypothetical protein